MFYGERAFQINCDWLASLLVYTDICDCQIFISSHVIKFHIESKWHIYFQTFINLSSLFSIIDFMFKNTNICLEIKNDCVIYARYIDNIFIIFTGKEVKLNNFLTDLNMMHDFF